MPDMERLVRGLELHLAPTAEVSAYVQGKHAGQNEARKQVMWIAGVVAALVVAGSVYLQ